MASQPTSRTVFAIAAASVVGAGTAAAAVTGTFPAIPALDHESHNIVSGGSTLQLGLSAQQNQLERETDSSAPFTSGPITGDSYSGRTSRSAGAATVVAEDLHQSDAKQIAALSSHSYTPHSSSHSRHSSSSLLGDSHSVSSRSDSRSIGSLGSSVSDVTDGLLGGGHSAGLAALSKAMTKLGKPYIWGAKGPNAFDCSGLVQWAFKQIGISVPGSTATQIHEGRPVSRGQLRPGDVVFFYHPVSHVGIYMGNGKVLHASEPGKPVKISKMNFPYNSARRFS
ncbi:MAG TPA: NlpC/P60 family protein [Pseudonocardia sp.]|jgi:cell wall-associated NlpC family hydrolase|nr:NlpC/P60 family protein [Pseudonocardia sp.]